MLRDTVSECHKLIFPVSKFRREIQAAPTVPVSTPLLCLFPSSPDMTTFRCFYMHISQKYLCASLGLFCWIVPVHFFFIVSRGEVKGTHHAAMLLM